MLPLYERALVDLVIAWTSYPDAVDPPRCHWKASAAPSGELLPVAVDVAALTNDHTPSTSALLFARGVPPGMSCTTIPGTTPAGKAANDRLVSPACWGELTPAMTVGL